MEFTSNVAAPPAQMIDTHAGPVSMSMENIEVDATKTTPWERRFNPYDFNGGYVAYVARWMIDTYCLDVTEQRIGII
jgi:hypothetical protein